MDTFEVASGKLRIAWKELEAAIKDELCCGKRRRKALETIKLIQNGAWDRNIPEPPKGAMAVTHWNDCNFSYGMDYGAIVALMQVFDLEKEDLL